MTTALSRRQLLAAAGVTGLSAAAYGARGLIGPNSSVAAAGGCELQREVTDGPFYLDLDLVRRDIRGGRKGVPLTMRFAVVNATTCRAIKNAAVEIWHADAAGEYSGVSGNRANWLRGIQRTNTSGQVRFDTIFPGWYPGRTPHLHMKVFVAGSEIHTGQVFFPPAIMKAVYDQPRYTARGSVSSANIGDGIYRQAGARAVLGMRRKGDRTSDGYNGSLTIGVDPS